MNTDTVFARGHYPVEWRFVGVAVPGGYSDPLIRLAADVYLILEITMLEFRGVRRVVVPQEQRWTRRGECKVV